MTKNEYANYWYHKNKARVRKRWKELQTEEKIDKAKLRSNLYYKNNKKKILILEKEKYHATKQLKGRPSGEKMFNWKGEQASYGSIHRWVYQWKGRPNKCEICGINSNNLEWSNIDHKYRRILDDYKRLCRSCHTKYDYENHLRNKGSRWGSIKNKV